MCPACIASAVWIAAGTTSMGGLALLWTKTKLIRSKSSPEKLASEPLASEQQEKEK